MPLFIHNPHSALAALEKRPEDVFEIRMPVSGNSDAWESVRREATTVGIPVNLPQIRKKSSDPGRDGGRTGLTEAVAREKEPCPLQEVIPVGVSTGLYLALDGVQDPQNLGSIFRTAAFFGVRGMILTRDRSAPVSQTVYDVASGGVEHVPFAIETNLSRAFDQVKERGLWILGSSEHAETALTEIAIDRPWLLVLGSEESGLRRLTLDKCDQVCAIKPGGGITSLNVAVAAGILISHLSQ